MALKVHPFSPHRSVFCCQKLVVVPAVKQRKTMSRRNGSGPKLDLKLNLSPPRVDRRMESPTRSATVSPTSPPSSCVSSEDNNPPTNSASPEATSMALVGCPCCLLYVMVSEEDPKCPQCRNTVLLNFLHEYNNDGTPKNPTNKRS
ncbi:protein GL2-INTERACTING REPRESSOR 1-like [Lotus japonicus]|uniref:protein GL2-INTERACTING REPRESSOR 1-like n=1 Tax=Lotus japonicus TaxID=34305 RepID=UPI00258927BE|nr:protein GL2-INTERACTING REPRESSOR 1-like [Lotus japonicus]